MQQSKGRSPVQRLEAFVSRRRLGLSLELTFMFRRCLDKRLNCVGYKTACKSKDNLGTYQTTPVLTPSRASIANKEAHAKREDTYSEDREPFDVADDADDETKDKTCEDGDEGIQRRYPRCGENGLVEGYDHDCVEIALELVSGVDMPLRT